MIIFSNDIIVPILKKLHGAECWMLANGNAIGPSGSWADGTFINGKIWLNLF